MSGKRGRSKRRRKWQLATHPHVLWLYAAAVRCPPIVMRHHSVAQLPQSFDLMSDRGQNESLLAIAGAPIIKGAKVAFRELSGHFV